MAAESWRVEVLTDAEEFAARGGPWLVAHAVDANVIGSALAAAIATGAETRTRPSPQPEAAARTPSGSEAAGDAVVGDAVVGDAVVGDAVVADGAVGVRAPGAAGPGFGVGLWVLVLRGRGEVAGVAMLRPGYEVFLPELPPGAAETVADVLHDGGHAPPGAAGDPDAARGFCLAWHRRTGRGWEQVAGSWLYVLDALVPPTGVPGERRTATADDLAIVVPWAEAFLADSGGVLGGRSADQRAIVAARVAAGEVSLWTVDGAAVSMAAVSPSVGGITRVNLVYTPPGRRGRGYGAAVSAAVTRRALDDGADTCMLYADVANPTSNGIYRRIGYRPFGESVVLRFTAS